MKVKLIKHNTDCQMRYSGYDDTGKYLKVDEIYEVAEKIVYNWHTEIYLKEFPDKKFNSVCFEEVD